MAEYDYERMKITSSEEYGNYLSALCKLASNWVPRIRVQYARKAYEMYQNVTVRTLVLEYGKEAEDLEKYRLERFKFVSEYGDSDDDSEHLRDSFLNKADSFAKTIEFLFEIDFSR